MKIYGSITNKTLSDSAREQLEDALRGFEGKKVSIKIEEWKGNRSTDQNNLYWKWLTILGDELGYTKDEMHDIVKVKFLLREVHDKDGNIVAGEDGEPLMEAVSTTKLSTKDFAFFYEELMRWSVMEFGVQLPVPEDKSY